MTVGTILVMMAMGVFRCHLQSVATLVAVPAASLETAPI